MGRTLQGAAEPPTPDSSPDIPPAETELPISCDKPSKTEIKKAIMTLRSGKAAGPDEIQAEAIKADIETAVQMLYSLFSKIWEKEEVPAQWKEGIIINDSCQKNETLGTAATIEGSCSCQRQARFSTGFYWRGWRRLSTPTSETSRQASGGTDPVPTRSPACASSWNSHWSGTPPLYINFIDYEKAFDSVDRETMWKLLRHYGVPKKIISLIQCTFQNCPRRPAVWKFRGEDWSPAGVPAFTFPLPPGHRLDHEDHNNR